ncbi:MAG: hypothetical protein WKG01_35400 [Kofleriaceae bacterium]
MGSLTLFTACGSAKVIQRTQSGGVIQLDGDRGKAMEQANQEMSAHCGPGNFTITQEGEEAVGTDTVAREDTAYGEKTSRSGRRTEGGSTSTAATSTRTATSWRVHYSCGNGAGGPPPGPAGAGPMDPQGDPTQPPPGGGPGY